MNKRLRRIGPLKAGVVLGVLYALLSLLAVPFLMIAGGLAATAARQTGTSIPFAPFLFGMGALFLPIFYGLMGFIFGVIAAAVYNLVAKWTGGLEITLEDAA